MWFFIIFLWFFIIFLWFFVTFWGFLVIFCNSLWFFVISRDFVTLSELTGGAGWRTGKREISLQQLVCDSSRFFVNPYDFLWFLVSFCYFLWFFVTSRDFVTWSELTGRTRWRTGKREISSQQQASAFLKIFCNSLWFLRFLLIYCFFCDLLFFFVISFFMSRDFVTSSELAGAGGAGWRTGKREISSQQPTSAFLLIHDPNVKKQS